jgi:hypothetical protein
VLEDAGLAGPGAVRQRPRSSGLRTSRALSLPRPASVPALWRRASPYSTGIAPVPRERRELHWLVPTTPVSAPLRAPECAEARVAPAGNHGQRPAYPAPLSGFGTRPTSAPAQTAQAGPVYVVPTQPVPVAAGQISFTRSGQVSPNGNVHQLSPTLKLGKRLKGEYVKVVLDTRRAHLTVYRQGRIFKPWPYPFLKK